MTQMILSSRWLFGQAHNLNSTVGCKVKRSLGFEFLISCEPDTSGVVPGVLVHLIRITCEFLCVIDATQLVCVCLTLNSSRSCGSSGSPISLKLCLCSLVLLYVWNVKKKLQKLNGFDTGQLIRH